MNWTRSVVNREAWERACERLRCAEASLLGLWAEPGCAHMALLPRTVQLLRERGMSDVLVAAGGIIPDADVAALKEAGIAEIFGPGTSIGQIARYFRENVKRS